MYLMMFVAGFVVAIIFLLATDGFRRKRRMEKRKALREAHEGRTAGKIKNGSHGKKKVRIDTYVKAVTIVVILHGLVMVTMSYVLAFLDKDAVVDVSTTLITEIVAPLCLYIGTNCIMNVFEKNELSFSRPIQAQKVHEVWDKTHEEHEEMEDAAG